MKPGRLAGAGLGAGRPRYRTGFAAEVGRSMGAATSEACPAVVRDRLALVRSRVAERRLAFPYPRRVEGGGRPALTSAPPLHRNRAVPARPPDTPRSQRGSRSGA